MPYSMPPGLNMLHPSELPLLLLLFSIFSPYLTSQAAPANMNEILDKALPEPGDGSHQAQINCYALPYGAIGFSSHILTFYTTIALFNGRSPWKCSRLVGGSKFDYTIVTIGLLITTSTSTVAIYRCNQRWEYILLAVWKLMTSLTQTWTAYRANYSWKSMPSPEALWLSIPGAFTGMAGLSYLVWQFWGLREIRISTLAFAIAALLLILVTSIAYCRLWFDFPGIGVLAFMFSGLGAVAALYSDWVLAVIKGNYIGLPQAANAVVFWLYFAAKRLPFLSH